MTKEKQRRIIHALITNPTRRDACRALGIAERTIYNYLQEEDFMSEYKAALDSILENTDARLKEAALVAINHLISVIEDKDVDEATKIKADRVILEHLIRKTECDFKYW